MNALWIAFATYSVFPVPHGQWTEQDMPRVLAFLPLVGAVIGCFLWGWLLLADLLGLGAFFTAAVAAVLPVLLSGGIHLDGFCDTMDALASHQPPERRHEILHDSNSGAFAVIGCICYFLLYVAALTEIGTRHALFLAAGFMLSRGICVWLISCLKPYGTKGMLAAFGRQMAKGWVRCGAVLGILIAAAVMFYENVAAAVITLCVLLIFCLLFRRMVYRGFHGFSGDLAGWFIQMAELLIALGLLAGGLL